MRPDLIFLDLVMPGLSGFDVLRELHHDPALRDIPVIVATSKTLTAEEREKLNHAHAPVISKDLFSSGEAKAETARILSRMELSSLLAASTEQS
jgi:CheY-like chemotaxis protein